jgi:hypothetical protein
LRPSVPPPVLRPTRRPLSSLLPAPDPDDAHRRLPPRVVERLPAAASSALQDPAKAIFPIHAREAAQIIVAGERWGRLHHDHVQALRQAAAARVDAARGVRRQMAALGLAAPEGAAAQRDRLRREYERRLLGDDADEVDGGHDRYDVSPAERSHLTSGGTSRHGTPRAAALMGDAAGTPDDAAFQSPRRLGISTSLWGGGDEFNERSRHGQRRVDDEPGEGAHFAAQAFASALEAADVRAPRAVVDAAVGELATDEEEEEEEQEQKATSPLARQDTEADGDGTDIVTENTEHAIGRLMSYQFLAPIGGIATQSFVNLFRTASELAGSHTELREALAAFRSGGGSGGRGEQPSSRAANAASEAPTGVGDIPQCESDEEAVGSDGEDAQTPAKPPRAASSSVRTEEPQQRSLQRSARPPRPPSSRLVDGSQQRVASFATAAAVCTAPTPPRVASASNSRHSSMHRHFFGGVTHPPQHHQQHRASVSASSTRSVLPHNTSAEQPAVAAALNTFTRPPSSAVASVYGASATAQTVNAAAPGAASGWQSLTATTFERRQQRQAAARRKEWREQQREEEAEQRRYVARMNDALRVAFAGDATVDLRDLLLEATAGTTEVPRFTVLHPLAEVADCSFDCLPDPLRLRYLELQHGRSDGHGAASQFQKQLTAARAAGVVTGHQSSAGVVASAAHVQRFAGASRRDNLDPAATRASALRSAGGGRGAAAGVVLFAEAPADCGRLHANARRGKSTGAEERPLLGTLMMTVDPAVEEAYAAVAQRVAAEV